MRMKNQLVVILLSLCLIFAFGTMVAAQEGALTDVSGHWAEETIVKWSEEGAVGGYPDGTFQPNRQITRAEFITVINKALGCSQQAEINFSDVKESNWFYEEVAKALKSGYMTGYPDGTFQPNNPISRQEAAVVFSRIMYLNASSSGVSEFADVNKIPAWSKGLVGAIAEAGYMGGYPDKTFQPTKSITRAESVTTLDRVIGELYSEAGVVGPETGMATVEGNITISKTDVTLQNTIVEGNLYLAEGIGDGTVILKNVTVNGRTIVRGGGIHSIIMYNFNGQTVVVDVPDGSNVRLVAQGTSTFEDVVMESDGILEEENLTGTGFTTVNIPAGVEVVLIGSFDTVDIEGASASVKVESGTIANLNIEANATNASVNLAAGSAVTNLTVNAPAAVTGTGTVATANIKANGVTIDQTPSKLNISDNITSTVGGKEVKGNDTSSGGGGGGVGGSTTTKVIVTNIEANIGAEQVEFEKTGSNSFNISVEGYDDNVLFKGVTISGTNVKAGTQLVINELIVLGTDFSGATKTVILNGGVVTTRDLLGAKIDRGQPGINLGALRGSGTMVIKGYLKTEDYTDSDPVTVTLEFSDEADPYALLDVDNNWLDFSKVEGDKTITGTIISGKEGTLLSKVDSLDIVWTGTVPIKIEGTLYTSEADIKAAIEAAVGGDRDWDSLTLSDLVGINISYLRYTLVIEGE